MPQIRPSRFAVWLEGDLKNLRASRRQCAQGQTWEMRGQSQAQERKWKAVMNSIEGWLHSTSLLFYPSADPEIQAHEEQIIS